MPKLVRDDGVEIHWEERGEGPVVFFVHPGWASMPSTYSALLTDLATDHRVVIRDLCGTGQSTRAVRMTTEDGPISRPDITAGVVRKITAPLRASARR